MPSRPDDPAALAVGLRGVTKRCPGSGSAAVVRLDLGIPTGSIFALIGPGSRPGEAVDGDRTLLRRLRDAAAPRSRTTRVSDELPAHPDRCR